MYTLPYRKGWELPHCYVLSWTGCGSPAPGFRRKPHCCLIYLGDCRGGSRTWAAPLSNVPAGSLVLSRQGTECGTTGGQLARWEGARSFLKAGSLHEGCQKMKGYLLMFLISRETRSSHRNKEKDKFTMITLSPPDSIFWSDRSLNQLCLSLLISSDSSLHEHKHIKKQQRTSCYF